MRKSPALPMARNKMGRSRQAPHLAATKPIGEECEKTLGSDCNRDSLLECNNSRGAVGAAAASATEGAESRRSLHCSKRRWLHHVQTVRAFRQGSLSVVGGTPDKSRWADPTRK